MAFCDAEGCFLDDNHRGPHAYPGDPPPKNRLAPLFSSAKEDWATPQDLFDRLNEEFRFELDAAALPHNAKCKRFINFETHNSLSTLWHTGPVFLNPPYSRELIRWVEKAFMEAALNDITTVMLVPARPDTKWFHRAFEFATELRFIKGRLRFGGSKTSAPFPSCLFVFRPGQQGVKTVTYYDPKATQ